MTNVHTPTIAAAIVELEWLNTIPHTLEDCCRIARDLARIDAATASGGRSSAPGALPPGWISDPTGDAAVAGLTAVAVSDAAATMLGALATIEAATVACIAWLDGHEPPPASTRAPRWRLADVIADLHHLAARPMVGTDAALASDIATEVTHGIAETATWLRAKAEGLWSMAPASARVAVVQRERKTCEVCTPLGREVAPTVGARCERCAAFIVTHKGLRPTAAIVRWFDDHKRLDVPPRLVNEAKLEAKNAKVTAKSRRSA